MSPAESDPAEAAAAEYLEAIRRGDAPGIDTFAARYPEAVRKELTEILPLIADLEEARGPEDAPRLKLPKMLGGDFRLTDHIGTGGMGAVYRSWQVSLKRPCAVKVLNRALAARVAERRRFLREARLIARLHHPNIVTVHSAGTDGEHVYYAMDLIEGPQLDSLCTSPEAVAHIGLQAANALDYAHSCGIIHCDVKPSNLLPAENGAVLLGDFGLAQLLGTTGGGTGGTLRYMSPETLEHGGFSKASDQYALGMTLRELLGDRALCGLGAAELKEAILGGRLAPPEGCPPELAAVIGKMTAADPERRYPSLAHAADDLTCFLEHRPVSVSTASAPRRLLLWARRKPGTAALCLFALTSAVTAVAALGIGYGTAARALKRAEAEAADAAHSATLARKTLNLVFSHISSAALPDKASAGLLAGLLPYYEDLVTHTGLPNDILSDAYGIIGDTAMRSGRTALAADAYAQQYRRTPSAAVGNRFAEALTQAGRLNAARFIDRTLIRGFSNAADPAERLAALGALRRLSAGSAKARELTMPLLRSLRNDLPNDPEILLVLADLMVSSPNLITPGDLPLRANGTVRSASSIYRELTKRYPGNPRYSVHLVSYATRELGLAQKGAPPDSDLLTEALNAADRLLGRWLGDTEISATVLRFWVAYAAYLKANGQTGAARAFSERLFGILDVLYHNRDTPTVARSCLLGLLADRMDEAYRLGDFETFAEHRARFYDYLKYYAGKDKRELRRRVDSLIAKIRAERARTPSRHRGKSATFKKIPEKLRAQPKVQPKTAPKAPPKAEPKAQPKTPPKAAPKAPSKAEPKAQPNVQSKAPPKPAADI